MAEHRFDPASIARFRFRGYDWQRRESEGNGVEYLARFHYALEPAGGAPIPFTEEVRFLAGEAPATHPRARWAAEDETALARALRLLHWIAGVSYYKAALPPEIHCDGPQPSPAAAKFLDHLYREGLGELAYRNRIDLAGRIRFPRGKPVEAPPPVALARRTAVPVGGGKDSIVTIEALKAAGEPTVLFSVGDYQPIRATSRVAGLPRILVERRISPRLLELNRAGAINGHVPVSAVIAAILTVSALVYRFDTAALSNERSASVPQLAWRGAEVNHQYSKSLDFERRFDDLVTAEVLPGYRYLSFLRPLSELAITAAFSRHAQYFPVFRSCNRAFHLDEAARASHWCGTCPKCHFVFLALAPWLEREALLAIFGKDLLADPDQEEGFAALLGLTEHRPLECVGEEEESAAALALLARDPAWRDHEGLARLVTRWKEAGKAPPSEAELEAVLAHSDEHRLPERWLAMLPAVPRVPRDRP